MTITFLPVDADTSTLLPKYTAQQYRQGQSSMYGGGANRRLGGRSGFRVDTPSSVLTATSTTWTLTACAAMIDPGATTHQGMYAWATDANVTGTVTAADSTNPRKDIVYIQINDKNLDSSGELTADVKYLAGTPGPVGAGTPAAPTLPARSFLVGTISVPVSGGGSPTVVRNPAVFVTAGARLPISSSTERDALIPYVGMEIIRTDLNQIDATGTIERWNGTRWDHFGHVEWTTGGNGLGSGSSFNLGIFTQVSGKTTSSTFVDSVTNGGLQFEAAGDYQIDVPQKWSGSVGTGRAFISIEDVAGTSSNIAHGRVPFGSGEDTASLSINLTVTAGQIIYPKVFQTSGGALNVSGVVRVKRVP